MKRLSTTYRYMIDIIRTDLFSMGELGVVNSEKFEKLRHFNLRTNDRILMKFDIQKELMSQSSYFKSRPDVLTLGDLEGEILENTEWRNQDEAWWIELANVVDM